MLNSISLKSRLRIKFVKVRIKSAGVKAVSRACAALVSLVLVAAVAPAFGQFTITASTPRPPAVFPGGQSSSQLTVNSASAIDVALSCAVTPVQTTGTPQCTVSPPSVTTPASPSLTITTAGTTPAALYTITVSGIDQNSNTGFVSVNLSVLAVTADYTLTVTTPVTPSSVTAGSGATAGITVTPLNGYTGSVTLSCSAVTPAVSFGPTCSFSPIAVSVASNGTATGTLTINTIGTTTTTASISHPGILYALFLPLPGLALVLLGAGEKKLLALLAPYGLALGLLLLPACGTSNKNSTTTPTGVTPKNTYTLTITGTDTNALAPSNGTQTVTLTVN